jgi:hypothetical protein
VPERSKIHENVPSRELIKVAHRGPCLVFCGG